MNVLIGDLFKSNAQTLVNTVNCVGVMGKGIALEFKKRFPEVYDDYIDRCKKGDVKLGQPYLFRRSALPWVLNFPTKQDWRSESKLEDIVRGLEHLRRKYVKWGIQSLAVPALGCGHGQLEWCVVGPTIYRQLARLNIPVDLYAPYVTPHEELRPNFREDLPLETRLEEGGGKRISAGWIALPGILDAIRRSSNFHPVRRSAFQPMAYFATVAGIPTGLSYDLGKHGLRAEKFTLLMNRLLNNGLVCEVYAGNDCGYDLGPTFQDASRGYGEDLKKWDCAIKRVAELFLRIGPEQVDLAATIHFRKSGTNLERGATRCPHDASTENTRSHEGEGDRSRNPKVYNLIRDLTELGWLQQRTNGNMGSP